MISFDIFSSCWQHGVVKRTKRLNQLLVRLSDEEKEGFEKAATLAGITTASWARQKLRMVAARELQEADLEIPFLGGTDIE
jgi:hypothetical protein